MCFGLASDIVDFTLTVKQIGRFSLCLITVFLTTLDA